MNDVAQRIGFHVMDKLNILVVGFLEMSFLILDEFGSLLQRGFFM